MDKLPILYPAQPGSPYTTLAADYTSGGATLALTLAAQLPDAPNLICLEGTPGSGVFRYTGKSGNVLTGIEQVEGPTATWPAGSYAFRGFSAYDHNSLKTHATRGSIPDLPNRVVYETDAAGNTVEIHQVYLPQFVTQGFPQEDLDNILCGGTWYDKYLACQPDASDVTRGSTSANSPGDVAAASKPHVVPWTDINWNNAKLAIENRNGTKYRKTGTCVALATESASSFYVETVEHLVGKRIYIEQDGVRYVRRIVRTGGDADANANAAKLAEIYPALPELIMEADSYEILKYYLPGGKEWFDLWAWAHMYRYQVGLGWPKGNTNWGKFHGDPRARVYEGIPDPIRPGYQGNAIARTLTGSGPLTWTLNSKESGIWDLIGNCWEWVDLLVGTTADHTIDPEYPGAGTVLPTANGNISALYDPAPDGQHSAGAEAFVPKSTGGANADLDSAYYWQAPGLRAGRRGGSWGSAATCSLAALYAGYAPSSTYGDICFRGVC